MIQAVEHRILDIELNRGDSPTAVSKLAVCLRHIYGGENLMRLLAAFGKNSFTVGRVDASDGKNKKDVFSKLLFYSMPSPDDTPDSLRRWQQQYHIKDVRLVEVALYAPKWATIIEQTIGWDGLTCADYYFRAHTCTECAEQEKAIIARYSPLAVDDLQNGAFDVEWFREAYHKLGKERFNTVYAAAKYVSNGQSHTRARRYADAALGKVNASDLQQEIIGKRNKDLLMSYTIIPLRNEDDLMERYLYIRQFQKESRSFGAQRQASERLASETALLNLSVNAGYESADLMMWTLETRLVEQMRHYFDYHEIDGINLRLYINEKGMPEWDIKKNGKTLKSIPAALKKNSLIIEMKEAQRKLKEQVARARMLFEKAMNEGLLFNRSDVEGLMKNPILLPILQTLVWTTASGHATGFYANGGLQAADHTITPLATHDKLRIAHPTDLYQSGSWHLYQKQLFNHSIVQPFKQVFRELYLPTVDEQPMYETRRYAGQQIQPRRTKALLTKHGWVADYENGMQRIYYKENIVATLYSEADWFSPSEVECPAIEYVSFTERRSDKPIPIEKMPARIFSEIMRDVDLVVSVAHVGGVDPESSHSTMEMRRCVLECVLPLFKLHNVHFKGNFVEVEGRLGIYHIHLGSTIVHQTTGNAIYIQPVYSGQRGRIFLPFLDEDPQTATLVSKVLLLAEDHKIKDPFILQQIVTNKN